MNNCTTNEIDKAIIAYNANNDFYLETHLSLALSMLFLVSLGWQTYRISKDIYKWNKGLKDRCIWKIIYIPIVITTILGFIRCLIRGVLFDRSGSGVRKATITFNTLINISYIFLFMAFVCVVLIWTNVILENLKMNEIFGDYIRDWYQIVIALTLIIPITIIMIGGTIWRFVESMIGLRGGRTSTNLATLRIWCGIIMGISIFLTVYCISIGLLLIPVIIKVKDKSIQYRITRTLCIRTLGICSCLLTKSVTFCVQIFIGRIISRWIVYLFVFGPEIITLYWACEIVYSTGRKSKKVQ